MHIKNSQPKEKKRAKMTNPCKEKQICKNQFIRISQSGIPEAAFDRMLKPLQEVPGEEGLDKVTTSDIRERLRQNLDER